MIFTLIFLGIYSVHHFLVHELLCNILLKRHKIKKNNNKLFFVPTFIQTTTESIIFFARGLGLLTVTYFENVLSLLDQQLPRAKKYTIIKKCIKTKYLNIA